MKKAIYGNLPVGDPGLPGQMTERDIPSSPDTDESTNNNGEIEVEVNWPEFNRWFATGGEESLWKDRLSIGSVHLNYTYNYDYVNNEANNIKIKSLKENGTENIIKDPYILESFGEYFEDRIRDDIEIQEEDSKSERNPDRDAIDDNYDDRLDY